MKTIAFIGQFQEYSKGNITAAVKTLTETREGNDQYPDNIELKLKRHQIKASASIDLCFLQIFKENPSQTNSIPSNGTGTETRSRENQDQLYATLEMSTKTSTATREKQDQKQASFFAIPRN
jgi:hypothetical protein